MEHQRGKANHIYNKYIKEGCPCKIEPPLCGVNVSGIETPAEGSDKSADKKYAIDEGHKNQQPLPVTLFDELQQWVFVCIYRDMWLEYRVSDMYAAAEASIKSQNEVGVEDFEYFEKLGAGGYGLVVHGRKKSTGIHYAIKVRTLYMSYMINVAVYTTTLYYTKHDANAMHTYKLSCFYDHYTCCIVLWLAH